MILRSTMHPEWLSNTYLVADAEGGHGVFVDAGADPAPLLTEALELGIRVTHVIATHRHPDHVLHNGTVVGVTGATLVAHEADADEISGVDLRVQGGEKIESGALMIEVLHIPGHTAGQIALLVNSADVFTGDTLFRGSIGGCVGPGHTTFEDLRHSLMETLFSLDAGVRVHPGHTDPTTIGEEWERNPFVRVMRGLDPEGSDTCNVWGSPATLVLSARDYDGGTKAWVRMDDGQNLVVPGSAIS
jgi:glyoxylase-like metal-dependent hydrolase (beta-lactamase superfamily II)